MTENSPFQVETEEHIAWVTLNRPEKRNAMDPRFFGELKSLFESLDEDPGVRVVVVRAAGKSFTAGLDLSDTADLFQVPTADRREALRKKILALQESMDVVERCRKPVIAAVHSHCVGGGVDLVCACDIRMATQDAVFSIRETRIAIVADLGTLQRLPFIIGHGWFRELVYTGKDFSAEEAYRMGFVTRLCDDRDALYAEARMLAREIAANSPLAVQGAKDVILHGRDHGVRAGLDYVAQKNAAVLPCEDLMEALQAFREKRPPKFTGA